MDFEIVFHDRLARYLRGRESEGDVGGGKMQVKNVLVTSDDGFDSFGVRVLVHHLKKKYKVKVAGTKTQQSGVGGKVSIKTGGEWGVTKLEGIEAVWVSGTPVDAIEVASVYFGQTFDLVVSGINLGENVGIALQTSGTFNAAQWSLGNGLGKRAIAVSWKVDPKHWFKDHDGGSLIKDKYYNYPGKTAFEVVEKAVGADFWGVSLLNVNLPEKKTTRCKFTRQVSDIKGVYAHPMDITSKKGRYAFPPAYAEKMTEDETVDFGAINRGYISITPCRAYMTDEATLFELMGSEMEV